MTKISKMDINYDTESNFDLWRLVPYTIIKIKEELYS